MTKKHNSYAHPNCFASIFKNCSHKISREHYISENLLKQIGKVLTVSGFPWLNSGEEKVVGKGSLTAKILCEKHNGELGKLDEKIGNFFATLRKFTTKTNDAKPAKQAFNGENIELWILKAVCALITSRNFKVNGKIVDPILKDDWVKILFSKNNFPKGLGIYAVAKEDDEVQAYQSIALTPYHDNISHNIIGAKLAIGGQFYFDLFLTEEMKPTNDHRYHPKELIFDNNGTTQTIQLLWKEYCATQPIVFKLRGYTTEKPLGY